MRQNDVFESGCEPIEVTSNHRPDTNWVVIDRNRHEHRWYVNGKPAKEYNPVDRHHLPTLTQVRDGVRYDEDGEEYDWCHYACRECLQRIEPGFTADTYRSYIPGLQWFRINGADVTKEEFDRRCAEVG